MTSIPRQQRATITCESVEGTLATFSRAGYYNYHFALFNWYGRIISHRNGRVDLMSSATTKEKLRGLRGMMTALHIHEKPWAASA
jgi:hypothetical protein